VFQKHKRLFGGCALPSRVARIAAGAALALAAWAALDPARGGVATMLAAVAVLIAGFAWLEGGPVSARDLTSSRRSEASPPQGVCCSRRSRASSR
jgi:hypothetical protein